MSDKPTPKTLVVCRDEPWNRPRAEGRPTNDGKIVRIEAPDGDALTIRAGRAEVAAAVAAARATPRALDADGSAPVEGRDLLRREIGSYDAHSRAPPEMLTRAPAATSPRARGSANSLMPRNRDEEQARIALGPDRK